MFSQGEINLMEKQVLFLFDYNLSITEEEVVTYVKPFTEEYSFNTPDLSPAVVLPALSAQTIPVTPRLPSGAAVLPSSSYSSKVNLIPRSTSSRFHKHGAVWSQFRPLAPKALAPRDHHRRHHHKT
jgi:hypothetical protein